MVRAVIKPKIFICLMRSIQTQQLNYYSPTPTEKHCLLLFTFFFFPYFIGQIPIILRVKYVPRTKSNILYGKFTEVKLFLTMIKQLMGCLNFIAYYVT